MIILHKPAGLGGERQRIEAVDPSRRDVNPAWRPVRVRKIKDGPHKGQSYLSVLHTGYILKRGRSEWVRVLPEEQEEQYLEIQIEIARLKRRMAELLEEGWVRADPYIHEEEKETSDV